MIKAFERSALYEDSHKIVEWESEAGIKQGRNIQLTPDVPPITGAILSDLTGGAGNVVRLNLQPPVPVPLITDLLSGVYRVMFTCDDSIVSHPALDRLNQGAENLTIGYKDADTPITLGMLTLGQLMAIITFTDTTTFTPFFDVADIVALAIAQGKDSLSDASIDVSSLADLTPYIGKTIDEVQLSRTLMWKAGSTFIWGTSHVKLAVSEGGPQTDLVDMYFNIGTSDSGPGLAHLITANSKLILHFIITTIIPGASHTLITSIDYAKLAAAAVDQSQDGIPTGSVYLCSGVSIPAIVDKTNLIGKTITSYSISAASPLWSSSSDPIINASSSFDFYYLEYLRMHTNLTATPFSSGVTSDAFGVNDDISILFTLDPITPHPTQVIIDVSVADMIANGTLTFPGVYTIDTDITGLDWAMVLTPLLGKHLVQIDTSIHLLFIDGSIIDLTLPGNCSTVNLYYPKTGSGTIVQYDLGNPVATPTTTVVDVYWDASWNMGLTLVLVPIIPSPIDVDIPIDAAEILANAPVPSLGCECWSSAFALYGDISATIKWSNADYLAAYIGYTVIDITLIAAVDYGPSPFDGTAYLRFGWIDLNFSAIPPDVINFASTLVMTSYHMNGVITDRTEMVLMGPYSWRISTIIPGILGLPIAYTEPQCIRNRSRHSIIVVGDKNFLPDYGYNFCYFWREYSHDGKTWVFIDKYLPLDLMSMQLTSDNFLLAGSEYPDWLDLVSHPTTFRGVTSYTDGRRFKNETWEWVRYGLQLGQNEGEVGPGPPIFATVMARE